MRLEWSARGGDSIQHPACRGAAKVARFPRRLRDEARLSPEIFGDSTNPDLKLRGEILAERNRNIRVLLQNLVQIRLDPPVESDFHGGEAQRRVRRK